MSLLYESSIGWILTDSQVRPKIRSFASVMARVGLEDRHASSARGIPK